MYIGYLLKIAKIRIFRHFTIRPEVAEIIIFHYKGVFEVYFNLPETMLGYDNTFNDDFRIFEKNRFFEIQKLAKKTEN